MHHIMHHNVRNKQVKKSIMHITLYRKEKLNYLQKKRNIKEQNLT